MNRRYRLVIRKIINVNSNVAKKAGGDGDG